jgi:hypothetical protein
LVEQAIDRNNNVSKNELLNITNQFIIKYGFDNMQIYIINKLIEKFFTRRRNVLRIRNRFNDNYELVQYLTGIQLNNGEIKKILVGPLSLDVFVTKKGMAKLENKSTSCIDDGISCRTKGKEPINFNLICDYSFIQRIYNMDLTGNKTRRHEQEHQNNALLNEVLNKPVYKANLLNYRTEKDLQKKEEFLKHFFYESRKTALDEVRNEIIAWLYSSSLGNWQKFTSSTFFGPGQMYDYLEDLRELESFKNDETYQKVCKEMMVVEYIEIIVKAVNSFVDLVKIGNYSVQEAIALLTDKQLNYWPKAVRRLLA